MYSKPYNRSHNHNNEKSHHSSSNHKKSRSGGAGAIVFGKKDLLTKIAETNNPIIEAKWEQAKNGRQEDLKLLLKQEDTFYKDKLLDFTKRTREEKSKMNDLVKNFDTSCEYAELLLTLVVDLRPIIDSFTSQPTYDDFKPAFTKYALSLITPEIKEKVMKASLETYPDFVQNDKTFMEKISEVGVQHVLMEGVYTLLCTYRGKFENMAILVGLQPNIMRGRLMGYDHTDLTTFGGHVKENETTINAALRELSEEAKIDQESYLKFRKARIFKLEEGTFCFEIFGELDSSTKSNTAESLNGSK
jgi:NUDIX domain